MFVVKSEGHKDGEIRVDLTSTQREYNVRLEQLAAVKREPGPKPTRPTKPIKTSKPPDKKVMPPDTNIPADDPPPDKKPEKKPGDKIDRSDTLDPFNRKRP